MSAGALGAVLAGAFGRVFLSVFCAVLLPCCTKEETKSSLPLPEPPAEFLADGGGGWTTPSWLKSALKGLALPENAATSLSDAAVFSAGARSFLVVVADEGHQFALVALDAPRQGRVYDMATLPRPPGVELPAASSDAELDLEAAAAWEGRLFLAGSASLKRRSSDQSEIIPASGAGKYYADYLYELRALAPPPGPAEAGTPLEAAAFPELELVAARNIRQSLGILPEVAPALGIPGKEGGLDVEGLVVHGGHFYFGLRAPLVNGRAIVVRTAADLATPELLSLDLGGLGMRALSHVEGPQETSAIYILAGPTTSGENRFALYLWNPDANAGAAAATPPVRLASVPSSDDRRPEALYALGSKLCIINDGVEGGAPRCRQR